MPPHNFAPHNVYFPHLMWLNLFSFLLAFGTAEHTVINYFIMFRHFPRYFCHSPRSKWLKNSLRVGRGIVFFSSGINVFACEYVECQKHDLFIWLRWNAWTCSNPRMESHNYCNARKCGCFLFWLPGSRATLIIPPQHFLSFRFISIHCCSLLLNAFFFSLSSLICFIQSRVQPHHSMFIGRRMIEW